MEVDTIIGIVAIALACVGAVAVYVYAATIQHQQRRDMALMTFAGFMMIGMLVPQLVKNAELGAEMHVSVSPFTPALAPAVILAKYEGESDAIVAAHKSGAHYSMILLVLAQFGTLVLYEIWIFQYASTSTDQSVEAFLYAVGCVYVVLTFKVLKWTMELVRSHGNTTNHVEIFSNPLNSTDWM